MRFLQLLLIATFSCVLAIGQAPHHHAEQVSVTFDVSKLPPPVKISGIGHSHITAISFSKLATFSIKQPKKSRISAMRSRPNTLARHLSPSATRAYAPAIGRRLDELSGGFSRSGQRAGLACTELPFQTQCKATGKTLAPPIGPFWRLGKMPMPICRRLSRLGSISGKILIPEGPNSHVEKC
jgi:hypothetical protein